MFPPTGASRARNNAQRSISTTSQPLPNTSGRQRKKEKARAADVPLDERLANYIIEGTRDGLIADLEKKRGRVRRRWTS